MNNEVQNGINDVDKVEAGGELTIFASLWKLFSSMKTAIILLLLLALASVFGTFRETPEVYHSWWYTTILVLMLVNLIVCSINRFGIAWRRTFAPTISTTPKQAGVMKKSEQFNVLITPQEAASRIVTTLRSRAYKVLQKEESGSISIYATKGRLAIWGPYLTHLSILVIFLGAVIGAKFGFEGAIVIPEGEMTSYYYTKDSDGEKPLGFQLKLHDFHVDYDKQGRPSAYNSDLEVFEGGRSIVRKVIDVNRPLTYKGISFFQASYGPILKVVVTSSNGEAGSALFWIEVVESEKTIDYRLANVEPQGIRLGDKEIGVFVHDFIPNFTGVAAKRMDALPPDPAALIYLNQRYPSEMSIENWKSLGWIKSGQTVESKGYKVTLETIEYSKLDISRNPGLPILYAGFILVLLGIFAAFYINHRIVRVSISPAGNGSSVVVGATSRAESSIFNGDFDRIRNCLEMES